MKLKKRTKRSRLRGQKTCGYGFRKKHRGKGSKAGWGMAGTGKKAGQRLTWLHKYMPNYLGKYGFKSIKQIKGKEKVINVDEINEKLEKLLKTKKAKETHQGIALDLSEFKVLGRGEIKKKVFVTAKAFSQEARKKIEAAGGKIEVKGEKKEEKVKEEKKEE